MTSPLIHRSLVAAACVVAFAVAAVPLVVLAQDQKETETVERTLPFPSGGTLKLHNFSGTVRITVGSGRTFVMKAVRRGTADRLKEIQLSVESSGSTITVEANKRDRDTERRRNDDKNNVIETSFEIQVPSDARLDIDAFSSDITITGVEGRQALKTFSGDITASGSRATMTANSFSGDIEVDLSGHGTSPDVEVETFSGAMRVRLADNARGDLEFNSFSGSFDAAFPVTLRSSSRRNVRAELPGGSGQRLRFKSFSGTLRLVK
jgi:hypothetical protein